MTLMAPHSRSESPTTTTLVQRCLQGDAGAWSVLIERYVRLVHAVSVRHGLTPAEVDDVGQEVFLALAQNLHEIEDPERLPGWLVTTARRLAWRALQHRRREESIDIQESQDADRGKLAPIVATVPTPDDLLQTWSRQEALSQGLRHLQPRCRTLLTLLFLDASEPSYAEISAQLDLPKGSIGPVRNRCLQQLRAVLEGLDTSTAD